MLQYTVENAQPFFLSDYINQNFNNMYVAKNSEHKYFILASKLRVIKSFEIYSVKSTVLNKITLEMKRKYVS